MKLFQALILFFIAVCIKLTAISQHIKLKSTENDNYEIRNNYLDLNGNEDYITYFANEYKIISHFKLDSSFDTENHKSLLVSPDSLLEMTSTYTKSIFKNQKYSILDCLDSLNRNEKKLRDLLYSVSASESYGIVAKSIAQRISKLPFSSNKIWLWLTFAELYIKPHTHRKDIQDVINVTSKKLDSVRNHNLIDTFELIKSEYYLGKFAFNNNHYLSALKILYDALEDIQTGKSYNKKQRYLFEALVCQALGDVYHHGELPEYLQKSTFFYGLARDYFLYASRFVNAGYVHYKAMKDSALLYSKYSMLYEKGDTINNLSVIQNLLRSTFVYWYRYYKTGTKQAASEINSGAFYSIASLLENKKYIQASLNYYQLSFLYAVGARNIQEMWASAKSISRIYALLKQKELAISWADQLIKFSVIENNTLHVALSKLNKGDVYGLLEMKDSAMSCLKEVQNDTYYNSSLTPIEYKEVLKSFYQSKYSLVQQSPLDSSAWYYKSISQGYVTEGLSNLSNLLQQETISLVKLNEHISDNNLKLESEAKNYFRIQDSIEKQNVKNETELVKLRDHEKKILADKIKSDSLYQRSIELLNTSLYDKNFDLIILVIIVGTLFISVVILAIRNYSKNKIIKANLHVNLVKKQSEIAFKNIGTHDIKKLISQTPRFIKSKLNSGIEHKNILDFIYNFSKNVSTYVNDILSNIDVIVMPLQQQIEMSKVYSKYYKEVHLGESYSVTINNIITNEFILTELPVPTYLINNFIKNSLEHGTEDPSQSAITVTVSSTETANGYKIMIDDDGCGINYSKLNSGTKKSEGIKFVLDSVENFNKIDTNFTINFSMDYVVDKSNLGSRGTLVTIEYNKK